MIELPRQVIRYGTVGLASNLLLYLTYLVLTGAGVEHKAAMTMLYITGVMITFCFNSRWTFGYRGPQTAIFIRYMALNVLGYIVNLSGLTIFVDWMRYPHQIIQAIMIIFVAVLLFIMQKLWVFADRGHDV